MPFYGWMAAVSLVLLVLVLLTERRTHRGLAWLGAVAVLAAAAVIGFLAFPEEVIAWFTAYIVGAAIDEPLVEWKGDDALPWGLIGLLYLALLAGMAAQYAFLKSPRARFRWTVFLKPFLASPVVFLPLLAGLESQLDDGPWTLPRLMLVFVAFQNGFFWKTFFDAQAGKLQVKE